jgi:hypothetical protein
MDRISEKLVLAHVKGFINKILKKYFFDLAQKKFSFRVVLRLRGIIVAPPIMVQSKNFFPKILLFLHN